MEILSEEDRQGIQDTADRYVAEEKVANKEFSHSRNGFILSLCLIIFYLTKNYECSTLIIILLSLFSLFMLGRSIRHYNFLKYAKHNVWAWTTPECELERQFQEFKIKEREKEEN